MRFDVFRHVCILPVFSGHSTEFNSCVILYGLICLYNQARCKITDLTNKFRQPTKIFKGFSRGAISKKGLRFIAIRLKNIDDNFDGVKRVLLQTKRNYSAKIF